MLTFEKTHEGRNEWLVRGEGADEGKTVVDLVHVTQDVHDVTNQPISWENAVIQNWSGTTPPSNHHVETIITGLNVLARYYEHGEILKLGVYMLRDGLWMVRAYRLRTDAPR